MDSYGFKNDKTKSDQTIEEMINQAVTATRNSVQQQLDNMWNKIYPVGSIYITTNSTNPSTLFGGTWEAYSMGRVLVGYYPSDLDFNVVGKVGGDKYINYTPYGYVENHTLTVEELPNHTHWERGKPIPVTHGSGSESDILLDCASGSNEYYTSGVRGASSLGNPHKHKFTGSPVRWENFPSYQVVKIWRRVA